ncbi:MAG: VOC family protein, partial [Bacteroidota bacterium]
ITKEVGQRISPALMFTESQNGNAEKAINFYTSVFNDSSVEGIYRYTDNHEDTAGNIAHARFRLENTVFMAMDSSYPHGFGFNEAISFVVECQTQQAIDYYWEKLSAFPEAEQCGWLKDQFGVSWQIIPDKLNEMMTSPEKAPKVVSAFLQMKKIDLKKLEEAYNLQE